MTTVDKTSLYSRSRAFRWGLWLLIIGIGLIAWSAVRNAAAKPGRLHRTEGTLVDYTSRSVSTQQGVQPGKRYRTSARTVYYLRIQKPDGGITEFSSPYPISAPRMGWKKGQRVKVQHTAVRRVYATEVDGEVVQNAAETRAKDAVATRSSETFAVLLLAGGLVLIAGGYLSSFRTATRDPGPTPSTPPPLP